MAVGAANKPSSPKFRRSGTKLCNCSFHPLPSVSLLFASDADRFSVSTNERAAIQMNRANQVQALNTHMFSSLTPKGAINDNK